MKKTIGAIIASTSPFEVSVAGQTFRWDKKEPAASSRCSNPLECFVPLRIERIDEFGNLRVYCENFPDHLLNHCGDGVNRSYPHLSLVEVVEEEEIAQQAVIVEKHSPNEALSDAISPSMMMDETGLKPAKQTRKAVKAEASIGE